MLQSIIIQFTVTEFLLTCIHQRSHQLCGFLEVLQTNGRESRFKAKLVNLSNKFSKPVQLQVIISNFNEYLSNDQVTTKDEEKSKQFIPSAFCCFQNIDDWILLLSDMLSFIIQRKVYFE
ncbi:Hypothetical_protein [Hexamita inflata]|uniref:Hypothetical_protein n=1 Tax=Hexamita inflata TaxID=28002 RepID=A0AA86REK7_9EUKA|nr:Hypothetical protein HINF_LOCUS59197 [Hexamita inflata]